MSNLPKISQADKDAMGFTGTKDSIPENVSPSIKAALLEEIGEEPAGDVPGVGDGGSGGGQMNMGGADEANNKAPAKGKDAGPVKDGNAKPAKPKRASVAPKGKR